MIAKVVFGLDLFLISLCQLMDYQSIWKCLSKRAVSTEKLRELDRILKRLTKMKKSSTNQEDAKKRK